MKWIKKSTEGSDHETLVVGRWNVGGIHYDLCRTKGAPLKYAATCRLPGIKGQLGYFSSKEEAIDMVEKAVTHWIKGMKEDAVDTA